jgi:formate hydrogenlyase subunit 4
MAVGVMNLLSGLIAQLLHIALMAATAPTLVGLAEWLHARLAGRHGPAVLQPWRDLAKLLRKQTVVAESASGLTEWAPFVCAAAVALAACLVPSFASGMTLAPLDDLLVIAGLLALARGALALAAMDAGIAPGGIAASRAMLLACGSEPALLLAVFAVSLSAGSTNLDLIAAAQQEISALPRPGLLLALSAAVLVALIDGNVLRRESSALELGGTDAALIEATEALRLLVWFNLIGAAFLPFGMAPAGAGPVAWFIGVACWLARTMLFTAAVATLRTLHGRLSLPRAAGLLGVAVLLGLLAILFLFTSMRTA